MIQSMDQLIASFTAGKSFRSDFNKNYFPVGTAAAGVWYDLSLGAGNPMMNSLIGGSPDLTHQELSDSTVSTATTATSGGNFATNVFTDTTHGAGRFTIGTVLTGGALPAGVYISALGTGSGQNNGGTYTLSQTVGTITGVTVTGYKYGGGIPHGGNVSPDFKSLSTMSAFSAAPASVPAILMLVDQLATYALTNATSVAVQNLTGQSAWPRYADGAGVRAYLTPSVVMGAGTPTVQLGYTNTAPQSGRTTPGGPSLPLLNTAAPVGSVAYSGTGVGKFGPFLPLQSGDAGIKSVETIQFSATRTSGCMNLVICRPLAIIPLTTIGVAGERDFLNMLPSFPRIYDGANLNLLMYAGAATPVNTSYMGHIDSVWG